MKSLDLKKKKQAVPLTAEQPPSNFYACMMISQLIHYILQYNKYCTVKDIKVEKRLLIEKGIGVEGKSSE